MQIKPAVFQQTTQPRFASAQERQIREKLLKQLGPHLDMALKYNQELMEGRLPDDFTSYSYNYGGRTYTNTSDNFANWRMAAVQNIINGLSQIAGSGNRYSD